MIKHPKVGQHVSLVRTGIPSLNGQHGTIANIHTYTEHDTSRDIIHVRLKDSSFTTQSKHLESEEGDEHANP